VRRVVAILAALLIAIGIVAGSRPDVVRALLGGAAKPDADAPPPEAGVDATLGREDREARLDRSPDASAATERERPVGSDAPPTTGPFTGVVVDENDRPLAGARVRVHGGWIGPRYGRPGDGLRPSDTPEPATTGSDGTFAFTLPSALQRLDVKVTAPRYASERDVIPIPAGAPARIRMLLRRPIRVRVLDGDAAPLADAKVLVARSRSELDDRDELVDEATTGVDGLAVVGAAGIRTTVLVRRPPWPDQVRDDLRVPASGLDLEIRLWPFGSIVGVVLDPEERPVAGAKVTASDHDATEWDEEATTDASGAFRLDGVPSVPEPPRDRAPYTVELHVATAGALEANASVPLPEPNETRRVTLRLARRRPLGGLVVDEKGAPVVGATVRIGDRTFEPVEAGSVRAALLEALAGSSFTTSGAGGVFTFSSPPDDVESVTAVTRQGGAKLAGTARVEDSGLRRVVRIVVRPAPSPKPDTARLSVRVETADGGPVPECPIEAGTLPVDPLAPRRDRMSLHERKTTDADGRATLEGLPVGRVILVVHPPRATKFLETVDVPAGESARTIRLPGGTIAGTVVALDGTPLETDLDLALQVRDTTGFVTDFTGAARTRSGREGAFSFTGLGPGEYVIDARDRERLVVVEPSAPVRAGDGAIRVVAVSPEQQELLQVEGEWIDASTGRAVDVPVGPLAIDAREGAPARDLFFLPFGKGLARTTKALPPGTYSGTLRLNGYADARIPALVVPDGSRPARLRGTLEPAGVIEGTVRRADGKALADSVADVVCKDRRARVAPDGSFTLRGPFEAYRTVELDSASLRADPVRVYVLRGTPARVEIVAQSAGAVALRIPDGTPPKFRVTATLSPIDSGTGAEPVTLEIDRAWLSAHPPSRTAGGLVPGRYRVELVWDGDALPSRTIEIAAGNVVELDVSKP
jgi:hypothetical protein